ncbi:MAG: OmpA family protein [Acidobacteria bacterium]|nr:OmpA family protein [Acidobacteriota bacterium]
MQFRFNKRNSGKLNTTVAVAGASLFICLCALLLLWRQAARLEDRLQETEARAATLEGRLDESREQAEQFRLQGERAQSEVEAAAAETRELTNARRQAELDRELAREDADLSREESEHAKQETTRLLAEAERMRQQRENELDRMKDALGRIADTRRTPMGMVVNLGEDSFLFDFNEDTLRPENRELLSRIAGVLLASHGYRLQIYGHTDDQGPAAYNQDLSERRAQSVTHYLIEAGIPRELVDVRGFGESSPRAKTANRQSHQKNRRVEIGVIDTIINYGGEVAETP